MECVSQILIKYLNQLQMLHPAIISNIIEITNKLKYQIAKQVKRKHSSGIASISSYGAARQRKVEFSCSESYHRVVPFKKFLMKHDLR